MVSGTVLSGSIRRDDIVELLPSGKQAKVRFIEVHHQRVEQAVAGQRVGHQFTRHFAPGSQPRNGTRSSGSS